MGELPTLSKQATRHSEPRRPASWTACGGDPRLAGTSTRLSGAVGRREERREQGVSEVHRVLGVVTAVGPSWQWVSKVTNAE